MLTEQQKEYLAKQKQAAKAPTTGGFDLRVQIKDKEGELTKEQPYFLYIKGQQQFFERPVNSGNLFFKDGSEAGRIEGGVISEGATHKAYLAPADEHAALEEQLKLSRAEAESIRKELAAAKAEKLAEQKEQEKKAQTKATALEKAGAEISGAIGKADPTPNQATAQAGQEKK